MLLDFTFSHCIKKKTYSIFKNLNWSKWSYKISYYKIWESFINHQEKRYCPVTFVSPLLQPHVSIWSIKPHTSSFAPFFHSVQKFIACLMQKSTLITTIPEFHWLFLIQTSTPWPELQNYLKFMVKRKQ